MEKSNPIVQRSHKGVFTRLTLILAAVLVAGAAWFMLSVPKVSATSNLPIVTTYRVQGVSVDKYNPPKKTSKPPIIMVHGGAHGKWSWQNWATFFSKAGYEVHVLDWYNHGDSDRLPEQEFIKRSIVDVARDEIKTVAQHLNRKPILIGHSMGGLASAVYAEGAPVEKLVLLTPVMPSAVKPDPVPLPIDMSKPFPVFPYEQAKQLFFTALGDREARSAYAQLVPESPQAVLEATRWTVNVDVHAIKAPKLLFATELDVLTPAAPEERYAKMLGARYEFVPGIGHSDILLKDPEWRQAAQRTLNWLTR
jgi:pimeloyl-ACP methyl ester carboxylesterase